MVYQPKFITLMGMGWFLDVSGQFTEVQRSDSGARMASGSHIFCGHPSGVVG
jgi:hypothetical protein